MRLINPETFDGSALVEDGASIKLTVYEKTPRGRRVAAVYEGDEATEARTEIRDMLAGQTDQGEVVSRQTPPRKARAKKGAG